MTENATTKTTMTETIKCYLSCPIFVCGALFMISVVSLGTALIAQYVFGLAPCPLCIYQRIPFVIIAILSMAGLIFSYSPDRMKIVSSLIFLSAICLLAGSIIAAYHTGVERHWWTSFIEGCSVDFSDPSNLLAMIENTKAARCDEIPWADPIIGLSMANYNAIISFGLAVISFASAICMTRRANGF